NFLVDHVDDALTANPDLLLVGIGVDDPVERLLGRRDVVAPGREHDDRRADRLDVERPAVLDAGLAARQLVADEQLLDDPVDLGLVQEMEAAPPFLELEEARPRTLRRGEEIVILAEVIASRIEELEIRHEMRAVELATAEVGKQEGR